MSTLYITLDCAPGMARPGHYIGGVLKDTGLLEEDFETGPPFFGAQVWVLKDASKAELFTAAQPVFKERISALYHSGAIRYGDW